MIFVTVGSQMPFRRLVKAADEWAQLNPSVEVVAQIGADDSYRPLALTAFASVSPARYAELVENCELLVAHAGMGSVLTALEFGKPMILMPRRGALKETRNDHQVSTLSWLKRPGIYAAVDEVDLKVGLDHWRQVGMASPAQVESAGSQARQSLTEALRHFIG